MIYRILSNESDFPSLVYDDMEIIEKIGEEYLIQADPSPLRYSDVWQTIKVGFVDANGKKSQKPIPDIQHHFGHLFLSDRAVSALKPLINGLGELLEIEYGNGKRGAIFNPLKIVKADSRLSTKNNIGDASSIVFSEEHEVFRTSFDDYYGVFCNQDFKGVVEKQGLTGIAFECDLSNVFEKTGDINKPKAH